MKLTYPACFYPCEEKKGGFTVEVPDLPGCVSEGSTLAEAILMGTDAASGWVLDELEDGKPAPEASPLESIIPEAGGFVSMLVLDMDAMLKSMVKGCKKKILPFPHGSIRLLKITILTFHRCFQKIPFNRPLQQKNSMLNWLGV